MTNTSYSFMSMLLNGSNFVFRCDAASLYNTNRHETDLRSGYKQTLADFIFNSTSYFKAYPCELCVCACR